LWSTTAIASCPSSAAAAASSAGDHGAAAASAEAALAHDPYDEVALRALMRAHAAAGRPASALAAYARVRARIGEDLGVDPTAETEAVHDEIVLGAADPDARPAPAGPATRALVGRAAERRALEALLDAVEAGGHAELVLVRGEAGIGKTALVNAWVDGAAGRAVVLRGRCDELGRDLPLQPVADALSVHLRGLGPAMVETVIGADGPVVRDVLGWSGAAATATTVAEPEGGRSQLFGALLAVTERAGAGRPVVLVIEDLHLAGASTLAWLAFARRRGRRLLLVATTRPGAPEPADATVLAVAALTSDETAELLGPLGEGRVADLHARSDGNPLLLLALATATGEDLPTSVREAAESQAASLGDAAATVRAAAVVGKDIDLDLVAEILRRPAVEVLADLERAAAVGLLEERGAGLEFRHELVRSALDISTGAARRQLLHREAARALEARPNADALAVAVHARAGGDNVLAIEASVRAGEEAYARFDVDSALAHLDAAVGLGGSATAFASRARVRMSTFDLDAAAADAAAAVAHGGGAAALEVAAWVAYYRRRYDAARAFADEGVARAGEDLALRESCLAVAGRVRHARGDLDGAVERLAASGQAPAPIRGVAQVWLGFTRVHQGDAGAALSTLDAALVDPDHLAHPWAGLHGRFARIMALGYVGRIGDAITACDDLDAAVVRTGAVGARFRGPAANVRGWVLRHAGAESEADDCNQATVDLTAGDDGGPSSSAVSEYFYVALLDLADGRLLAGDVAGAAALASRLAPVDTWQGTMAWHQRHRLGLLRARLALADGDGDAAAGLAAAVVADAAARGAHRYEVLGRAWLALAGGDGDRDRLATVVDGLGRCAALEGWRLTAALGKRFDVDAWCQEAQRRASALVTGAGPCADALRQAIAGDLP
jgi:hypothetical protein